MTNSNTAAQNIDGSDEVVAALEQLAQMMLGGMTVKPIDVPDLSDVDATKVLDYSSYQRVEAATDSVTDALSVLRKGADQLDEAICVVQKIGLSEEEVTKRIDMIKIVDQALVAARNSLTDILSDLTGNLANA